jgi:hypothetical protein
VNIVAKDMLGIGHNNKEDVQFYQKHQKDSDVDTSV